MNKDEFKKQFPSLQEFMYEDMSCKSVFNHKDLQEILSKHCLDKQKTLNILEQSKTIKEAIQKLEIENLELMNPPEHRKHTVMEYYDLIEKKKVKEAIEQLKVIEISKDVCNSETHWIVTSDAFIDLKKELGLEQEK